MGRSPKTDREDRRIPILQTMNLEHLAKLIEEAEQEVTVAELEGSMVEMRLDLRTTLAICGNIQIALVHPGNTGRAPELAAAFVEQMHAGLIERGMPKAAEILAKGGLEPPALGEDGRSPVHERLKARARMAGYTVAKYEGPGEFPEGCAAAYITGPNLPIAGIPFCVPETGKDIWAERVCFALTC
jgi:hypothetical protein